MNLYYLPNARSDKQRAEMVALEAAKICIFCPESYDYNSDPECREVLLDYPGGQSLKKQVLLDNGHCVILRNEYPYPGAQHHYLATPRRHITSLLEMTAFEWAAYRELILEAAEKFRLVDHFGMSTRNGDMAYTGGTIAHVHTQLTQVDQAWTGNPIMHFMSSRPEDPPSA